MSRNARPGPGDDPRVGGDASAPLRQTQLPLRGRGSARGDGAVLLRARPDPVPDAAASRGGRGHRSGGPLPGGRGRLAAAGEAGRAALIGRLAARRGGGDRAVGGRGGRALRRQPRAVRAVAGFPRRRRRPPAWSMPSWRPTSSRPGRELLRQLMQEHMTLRAARATAGRGRRRRRSSARRGRGRSPPDAGQCLRPGPGGTPGLPPPRAREPAPRRRGAEPAGRAALPRAAPAGRDRIHPRLVRRSRRGHQPRYRGPAVGKRQVEELTAPAAVDIEDFYAHRRPHTGRRPGDVLVLSADAKGIVMRPDALRPATAKAAAKPRTKLATRLSKGEKRNRKRLAEVGAVYDLHPVPRKPPTSSPGERGEHPPPHGTESEEQVADRQRGRRRRQRRRRRLRRSRPPRPGPPTHLDRLVDGNNHQIDRIQAEASTARDRRHHRRRPHPRP